MNLFNKKIKLSNLDKILIIIIVLLIVFNFTNWFCNIIGIGSNCSLKEGKKKKNKDKREKKKKKKIKKKEQEIQKKETEKQDLKRDFETDIKNNYVPKATYNQQVTMYNNLSDEVDNIEEVYGIIEDEVKLGATWNASETDTQLTGVLTDDNNPNTTPYNINNNDIYTVGDLVKQIKSFFTNVSSL